MKQIREKNAFKLSKTQLNNFKYRLFYLLMFYFIKHIKENEIKQRQLL